MATIRDVARRAGVSVATVSYVINGTRYVSPELKERVQRAIEELNYYPHGIARSLKTRKTHTLGLIVSDISNPFFSTLARGAEDEAAHHGYSLILANADENPSKERLYIDVLTQKKVDGLVIAPSTKGAENIQQLQRRKISFVFVDRKLEGVEADAVLSENVQGAYQAVRHLLELGHRRIAIVLGLKGALTSEERFQGYKLALSEFRVPVDPALVAWGHFRMQGGFEAASQLLELDRPPTAIFSTNNLMTIGVMKALKERGLRCPEDVSIVGFDELEWGDAFEPALTVVIQSPYKLGRQAVRLLLQRLQDYARPWREVRIPTRLEVRESTAPPRTGERERRRRRSRKTRQ